MKCSILLLTCLSLEAGSNTFKFNYFKSSKSVSCLLVKVITLEFVSLQRDMRMTTCYARCHFECLDQKPFTPFFAFFVHSFQILFWKVLLKSCLECLPRAFCSTTRDAVVWKWWGNACKTGLFRRWKLKKSVCVCMYVCNLWRYARNLKQTSLTQGERIKVTWNLFSSCVTAGERKQPFRFVLLCRCWCWFHTPFVSKMEWMAKEYKSSESEKRTFLKTLFLLFPPKST